MRLRRGILGLALLAAAAAVAWWARPEGAPLVGDAVSPDERAPDAAPSLAGGRPAGPAPGNGKGPSPKPGGAAPAPPAGQGPALNLVLRGATGGALEGVEVRILEGERTFPGRVDAQGRLEFAAEALRPEAAGVLVVTRPGGHMFFESLSLLRRHEGQVLVPDTVTLAGRVVDRAGRPVPGLRLVFTDAEARAYAAYARDLDLPLRFERDGGGQHATATTDAGGRYEARVARGWSCTAIADSKEWFLEGGRNLNGIQGDVRDATLLAWPALTLEGRVTDAGTGEAIGKYGLSVEQREVAPDVALRFGDWEGGSPYRVTWARGIVEGAATYDVTFDAEGYVPEKTTLRWLPGETTVVHDARLRTIASMGGKVRVTLDVVDSSGKPSELLFFLEVRTGTETPTVMSSAKMTRVEGVPGRYLAEIPPGRWDLRVVLPQHFYWVTSWHGPVLAETGREATVRCEVPTSSPLAIRWIASDKRDRPSAIGFRRVGEASWSTESTNPQEATGTTFPAWPIGTWEFSIGPEGAAPEDGKTGLVEVVAGQPATLDLSR